LPSWLTSSPAVAFSLIDRDGFSDEGIAIVFAIISDGTVLLDPTPHHTSISVAVGYLCLPAFVV
jgi:hypothetical protein